MLKKLCGCSQAYNFSEKTDPVIDVNYRVCFYL